MGTAGIGLALAPPGGPLQMEPLVGDWVDQDAEQAPHLRRGERDQVAEAPFLSSLFAAARVTSRKACASKQSVIWRYQPSQRRTSY